MLRARELPRLYFFHVELDRTLDRARGTHVVLDELSLASGKYVEHIVQYQHLAMAVHARADADRRSAHRLGNALRERSGNRFEHDHAGAGFFQQLRLFEKPVGRAVFLALDAIAAKLMHRLRRETEVAADGNAAL